MLSVRVLMNFQELFCVCVCVCVLFCSFPFAPKLTQFTSPPPPPSPYTQTFGYSGHESIDNNNELFALGLTNIIGSLFSCIGTGAGFSRSSLNNNSGAHSQFSGFVSGLATLVFVLTLRSLLQYLPKLALSIMILFAVAKLIDVPTMIRYYKVSPWDCATMLVTLCMTLVLGVANGMLASIGFSVLVFINYAHQPTISRLGRYFGSTEYAPTENSESTSSGKLLSHGQQADEGIGGRVITISKVLVLRFEAPLFFANCRALSRRLLLELERRDLRKENRRWVGCVLDLGSVGWVDVTAADVLKHPVKMFGKRRLPIYLARANGNTAAMLRDSGLKGELEKFGGGASVSVHDAVKELLNLSRAAEKAKRMAMKVKQQVAVGEKEEQH